MEVHVNQIEKRSWIEIDLAQLKSNYLIYKKHLKTDADIMAVIKADAYGHGDVQVARMLSWCGCHLFAVSNIDEAVGLREAGIQGEILLLGYSSPYYAKTLFDYDLTQAIVSEDYAEALASTPFMVKCQFAIDTGMNRIGLDADDSEGCEQIIRKYYKKLNVNGMFTHLCVADTNDDESRIADLNLPYIHCCNSAAGLHYLDNSDTFSGIGSIVRLGIILFGLQPDPSFALPKGIAPAMPVKPLLAI